MASATRAKKRKGMLAPEDLSSYKCSICLDFFTNPVQIACGNSHTYCHQCIQPYQQLMEPRCPQCRQIFDPKTLKLDEQKIDSMKNIVPCKWCQKQMPIKQQKDHLAVCDMVDKTIPKFKPVKESLQQIPQELSNRSTFSCPFCGEANLDTSGMLKHCNENHLNEPTNVVCPICAAMPWGDRSQRSVDFIQHLNMRHKFDYDTYADFSLDDDEMLERALQASLQDV